VHATINNEHQPNAANIRVTVPKSLGAEGDFGHFRSLERHVDSCVSLATAWQDTVQLPTNSVVIGLYHDELGRFTAHSLRLDANKIKADRPLTCDTLNAP